MPDRPYPDGVQRLQLFEGISEEERHTLLEEGRLRRLTQGEYLFRYGDAISSFYIVYSGIMQLMRETPDGKEVTTDISCRGSILGKSDILETFTKYHRASAIAVDTAEVLEFPVAWLRRVVKYPPVALNILSAVSHYAHMVEMEAEQKSTMTAAQRVGCFLQRLCVMHQLDPRGFELPYSKTLIASRLGMEPETFSRALAMLRKHGIQVKDMHIAFCDIQAMEEFVCEHCSIVEDCPTHQQLSEKLVTE